MSGQQAPRAARAHIKAGVSGKPFIEAQRCRVCGAMLAAVRLACPACAARDSLEAVQACETGRLIAYSIVRRSYPGVQTPFVSAVVTMDDGLTLKANLVGVEFEPDALNAGARVRLTFNDAIGRTDAEGNAYIGYQFELAKD